LQAFLTSAQAVRVIIDPQLTTRQAAELLNVSHGYLIGLLDAGVIRSGGERRWVETASLIEYRRDDDLRRLRAADELSAITRGWA
jgi:excisionase family DNA binding protein